MELSHFCNLMMHLHDARRQGRKEMVKLDVARNSA